VILIELEECYVHNSATLDTERDSAVAVRIDDSSTIVKQPRRFVSMEEGFELRIVLGDRVRRRDGDLLVYEKGSQTPYRGVAQIKEAAR
jgi:hypothetical protein